MRAATQLVRVVLNVVGFSCVSCLLTGCFFFNSEWGARERAQRNVAERHTPELATSAAPSTGSLRTLRVRVLATPAYRARNLQWSQRARQAMDAPNAMLVDVGIRLLVVDTQAWDPDVSEDSLPALLTALQGHDTAEDVDWVVGLVGSVPRLTESFHDLGWAPYLGKHFVMRGANDQERHQIDEAFDELDEAERDRLYERRATHKFASLFLHELGHTLGAPHVRKRESLMYPNYSTDMLGFTPETVELLKLGVRARFDVETAQDQSIAVNALLQYVKAHVEAWAEPADLIAWLEQMMVAIQDHERAHAAAVAPSTSGPSQVTPAPASVPVSVPATVPSAAHDDFVRTKQAEAASRLDDAWTITTALTASHPDSYPIAELHCTLANKRRLAFRVVEQHCATMMRMASEGRAQ